MNSGGKRRNFFLLCPHFSAMPPPQFEGALRTPGWAQRCAVILFVRIKNYSVPDSTIDETLLESVLQ